MPYTMPNHIKIQVPTYNNRTRNAEQRETATTNAYNAYDSNVSKMYPERNNLPQGVKDAIRYSQTNTY